MDAKEEKKPHGKEAVKKALVDAAADLIAKKGVEGISFRSVATAAGVNHALITRHFGNKAVLVNEVANALVRDLFKLAVDSHDPFAVVWHRGFGERTQSLKALLRILLEAEGNEAALIKQDFMRDIFAWFGSKGPGTESAGLTQNDIVFFLTASLVLGSELVGPSFQKNRGLTDDQFSELKKQAYESFLQVFRGSR